MPLERLQPSAGHKQHRLPTIHVLKGLVGLRCIPVEQPFLYDLSADLHNGFSQFGGGVFSYMEIPAPPALRLCRE